MEIEADNKKAVEDLINDPRSVNQTTLPADILKPKPKPRDRRSNDTKILEELKNIRRLLALPLSGVARNDKDNKFVERMNK